ncbi:MAG: CaiB/BaiF CoA transferase family protein [Peptoniphilaceae bacterium]
MNNNGALSNLKILDFTTLLPGPYASLMLADMGADVLKISSKSKTDLVLDSGEIDPDLNLSANLMWLNRNKKTISLNLKTPEAIEIIKKLIMEYDIIIEQFRPGVMDKLGLGYDELKKINPKLIFCSISGYGHSGPLKNKAGHDLNFIARSGIMASSGRKKTGPPIINTQIADLAGGALHGIIGILAAVNFRNQTNIGQYIDVSMLDTIIPLNTFDGAGYLLNGKIPQREEEIFNGGGIYDYYETSDGRYLSIASLEPKFLKILSETLNLPQLIENGIIPEDEGKTKNEIKKVIKSKSLKEWISIFEDLDSCVEPVLNIKEALEQEQVKERGVLVDIEEKGKTIKQFAMPIKFSKSKAVYKHPGREIGSDTKKILFKLGFSEKEIKKLENKNVFK